MKEVQTIMRPFTGEQIIGKALRIALLPTGDVKEITKNGVLYTGFCADPVTGAAGALYLRVYRGDAKPDVYRLNGGGVGSFGADESGAVYAGNAGGVEYRLTLRCDDDAWFYTLTLSGKAEIEVLYTQDIGVGDRGFVRNNELYAAQYLGHTVKADKYGYTVASRQNLGGRHPLLVQGALGTEVTGYCTDGLQFFGSSYRVTGVPELLDAPLPNVNHQYEMPFIALCTRRTVLSGKSTMTFYGQVTDDAPAAATGGMPEGIEQRLARLPAVTAVPSAPVTPSPLIGKRLTGAPPSEQEIAALYPDRKIEERDASGTLLSFFTPDRAHVVTQQKEAIVQRPHGHIAIQGFDLTEIPRGILTNTSYMYGLFCSQTLVGNTSYHKLTSVSRGFLDTDGSSGLRIYVKLGGVYRRLGVASLFEAGLNYARYHYALPDDRLEVRVFTASDRAQVNVELTSCKGKTYDCLVTLQTAIGEDSPVRLTHKDRTLHLCADAGVTTTFCPALNYTITCDRPFTLGDDRIFYSDDTPRNGMLLTMALSGKGFTLAIAGSTTQPAVPVAQDFAAEQRKTTAYYDALLRGVTITGGGDSGTRLDVIARWFAHDCLIHYASPHGLEQTGGAAWGTRDVCQGPVEFFLTFGHYDTVREILRTVFAYQNLDGEWPQWFMFDEYPFAADDCHGDIVFWPLKALADYLARTGDGGFLSETLPYRGTDRTETVQSHVQRALDSIRGRLIGDSGLITYAGGDWDDTLQPVNADLKSNLISGWTMALAYQTLNSLSAVLPADSADRCSAYAARIKQSFDAELIGDGVIAGFGYLQDGKLHRMLHPDDEGSGIKLRLLPLTRTILAGMASPTQARRNVKLIDEHLRCPDGVRLMDAPARYEGGVSKLFVRAEQAANVGREISLQYVHAHIRYIEAMAALGRADDAFWGLLAVTPAGIHDTVPNALPRQANCYSSSSEGVYHDRYEYRNGFARLKSGDVPVRSGWRVYSSGGGIYLARLIGDVLGIRLYPDRLECDPVLPHLSDPLRLTLRIADKTLHFEYRKGDKRHAEAGGKDYPCTKQNPYRPTATVLPLSDLHDGDTVTLYLP